MLPACFNIGRRYVCQYFYTERKQEPCFFFLFFYSTSARGEDKFRDETNEQRNLKCLKDVFIIDELYTAILEL